MTPPKKTSKKTSSPKKTSKKTSKKPTNKQSSKVKRIYRDTDNAMLGGVCAGIANYLEIDASIMRLAFIFIPGIGWFSYFVFWVILPAKR